MKWQRIILISSERRTTGREASGDGRIPNTEAGMKDTEKRLYNGLLFPACANTTEGVWLLHYIRLAMNTIVWFATGKKP